MSCQDNLNFLFGIEISLVIHSGSGGKVVVIKVWKEGISLLLK